MELFVLFLVLGLVSILVFHYRNFLQNFGVNQQAIQTVGTVAFIVGILSTAEKEVYHVYF